jgi:hypothetical protein
MDNPEKLATYGTQDEEKQNKHTTQYVLQCSLTFIYLVYHMLPVSLDCPYLIAPSVFSNVYLSCVPYVASFSGLSSFDCPFSVL